MDGILVSRNGWLGSSANIFLSTHNPISMENLEPALPAQKSTAPKKIKSADVRRLKRQGYTPAAIADHLGVSPATVYYHLIKKKRATTEVKTSVSTSDKFAFEVNLYGVSIKLQQRPTTIEQRENAILIS